MRLSNDAGSLAVLQAITAILLGKYPHAIQSLERRQAFRQMGELADKYNLRRSQDEVEAFRGKDAIEDERLKLHTLPRGLGRAR